MTAELKVEQFHTVFGRAAEVEASAPGVVTLMGEGTFDDDARGLQATVPLMTRVEVARRPDRRVEIVTLEPERRSVEFELGSEARDGAWSDHAKAVPAMLAARGVALGGFSVLIRSSVPWGAGLSSSAALVVALTRAISRLHALTLTDFDVAMLAHAAERDFVGKTDSLVDGMAASLGEPGGALFIDARTRQSTPLALPAVDLVILDAGTIDTTAAERRQARRAECRQAAAALGVASLRDVEDSARASELPAPLDRRVRHVVSENRRVHDAARAIEAGDVPTLGQLLNDSHRSFRDDFEASTSEVDALVESARSQSGVHGARTTGTGRGGLVLALARHGQGAHVARLILEHALAEGRTGTRVLLTGRELG